MTSQRRRLPSRRASLTFNFEAQGLKFTCTASRFASGELAEVFISNGRAGSMASVNASDAAIVCSLALQFGVPAETIRHALLRDQNGRASGPLAAALDILAGE